MRNTFAAFLALSFATAAFTQAPSQPPGFSPTGQPAGFDVAGKAYVVDGYRSAKWGMLPAQVRAGIARDFPSAVIAADIIDPINHTTAIVARLKGLEPGPGPAAVTYIFGASSGRLMRVNLDWSFDRATPADREVLTNAGAALVRDLLAYYWKLMSVARGVPLNPNTLVLFAGTGETGGAVDVRLQGVGYLLKRPDGAEIQMPPPPAGSQALLHMDIAQTTGQPDVYRIKPGDF